MIPQKKKKKNYPIKIPTKVITAHIPTKEELNRNMDIRSHLDEPTDIFS